MYCFDGVRRISRIYTSRHGQTLTLLIDISTSFTKIFPYLGWDALPPSEGNVFREQGWDLVEPYISN